MLDDKSQAEVNTVVRTTRIIVFALCAGITMFAVYVLFFHQAPQAPATTVLTYVSLGFTGLLAVLSFIIPRVIVSVNRKQIGAGTWNPQGHQIQKVYTDAGRLAMVYQTTTIVGCALLEGAAFFTLIAHMVEGHVTTLIAPLLMLIGVALHMPLGDRITDWVENQLQLIDDDRRFRR